MHDRNNTLPSTNDPGSGMDPIGAWQVVLGQLQQEMGKATYDAWVSGASFEGYEDGSFIIGVSNGYARDWLESRLTSTITRQLVGLMNREVEVRFVVSQSGDPITHQVEPQSLENLEKPVDDKADETLSFSIDRELLQAYTKPDAALYFETYWLRWVPYIGAGPFLTVLAFRQALYYRQGCFEEDEFFSVSADDVGAIIGSDRRLVWRHRDGYTDRGKAHGPKLTPFIRVKKTQSDEGQVVDGQFQRASHAYAFNPTPITPADQEDILNYLLGQGFEKDPVAALKRALEASREELIRFPMPAPTKLQKLAEPENLVARIEKLCDHANLSDEDFSLVSELASKLVQKILRSEGLTKVPLYFLKHVVPYIGQAPAALIIWLRSHGYRNSATSEIRDRIGLADGRQRIANYLGCTLSGIYKHLPGKLDTEKKRKIGEYIQDYQVHQKGSTVTMKVEMDDLLVPEHRKEYEEVRDLVTHLLRNQITEEEVRSIFEVVARGKDEGESPSATVSESLSATVFESPSATIAESLSATIGELPSATVSESLPAAIGESPSATIVRVTFRDDLKYLILKYLNVEVLKNIILNRITNITTSTPTPTGEKIIWSDAGGGVWEIEKLMKSCRVDAKKKRQIRENNATAAAFVSWLLYAMSPQGSKKIDNAVGLAVARVAEQGEGDVGAGTRFDRLAALGPIGLQRLIQNTRIDWSGFSISGELKRKDDWEKVMGDCENMDPIWELGEFLGLLRIES